MASFEWLTRQVELGGDVLSWHDLLAGFEFDGHRIPLVSPQGIFKPKVLDLPLTIRTSPDGPYDDSFDPENESILRYRYRGDNPNHPDNQGLVQAMLNEKPLVYFLGLEPGKYVGAWPVYIVGVDESSLTFTVTADDYYALSDDPSVAEDATPRREYITSTVRRRLHQHSFRQRVLRAYRSQCALCRLKREKLLDAAHIIPDRDSRGEPLVQNGISMCKLHHAAFDRSFLGVSPDYEIHIRNDILEENDGPMLQHGLKEMHGQSLILPRSKGDWPDRERLDFRYQQFRNST